MTIIWHRFTCWHVKNRIDANRRHVLRWFVGEIVAFKPNTLYLQTWQVLCWELLRCLFISGTKKALHGLSRAQILWENGCWSAKFQHVSSLTSSDCCYAFKLSSLLFQPGKAPPLAPAPPKSFQHVTTCRLKRQETSMVSCGELAMFELSCFKSALQILQFMLLPF